MLLVERGENPDRERRRTAAVDELEERMEVVATVPGESRGEGEPEPGLSKLGSAPGDDLLPGVLVHVGLHAVLVARGVELLPRESLRDGSPVPERKKRL